MFSSPAFAQSTAGSALGGNGMIMFVGQMLLLFVIFYFLMIRPQQKRAKAHRDKIDAVKRGDQVVTGGGLVGKVTKVEDAHVEIEIATGVKVKAVRSTLTDVLTPSSAKPAND